MNALYLYLLQIEYNIQALQQPSPNLYSQTTFFKQGQLSFDLNKLNVFIFIIPLLKFISSLFQLISITAY